MRSRINLLLLVFIGMILSFCSCQKDNDHGTVVVGVKYNGKYTSNPTLEALKQANPGKSFVYVFQTTKEGNFRGANEFQHDVDIVIEVPEKGLAVQNGRYNQGGKMRIFENGDYLREAA